MIRRIFWYKDESSLSWAGMGKGPVLGGAEVLFVEEVRGMYFVTGDGDVVVSIGSLASAGLTEELEVVDVSGRKLETGVVDMVVLFFRMSC